MRGLEVDTFSKQFLLEDRQKCDYVENVWNPTLSKIAKETFKHYSISNRWYT